MRVLLPRLSFYFGVGFPAVERWDGWPVSFGFKMGLGYDLYYKVEGCGVKIGAESRSFNYFVFFFFYFFFFFLFF